MFMRFSFSIGRRWRSRRLLASVVLAVAAIVATAVSFAGGAGAARQRASAAPTQLPPAAVAPPGNGAAVAQYWTADRMAAATPLTPQISGGGGAAAVQAGASATGNPGVAGGFDPSAGSTPSGAAAATMAMPSTSSPSAGAQPFDGAYAGPNDTYNYPGALKTFPASTVGKLFFTEPGVGNFVCSAAATYGGGTKNMVWTAGHCVGAQGGRAYYSNWLFCPQYNNGEGPKGCYTWALAQQTGGGYFNGYWSADYAYLYMAPTSDKVAKPLVSAVGGLGFSWNWGRDQHWADFGYPSASPYNGAYMVVSESEHRYDVANPGGDPGQPDNSIGSSQTPGFSGGPWILSFGPKNANDPIGHGNWINSVNSYYFTSGGPGGGNEYGREIQGPYFDTNACNFWKGGSGWTGSC